MDEVKVRKSCCICGIVKNDSENISFHRLPKDKEKLKAWLEIFGINTNSIKSNLEKLRLCSRHFNAMDFCDNANTKKRMLIDDAVPSIISIDGNTSDNKRLQISNCERIGESICSSTDDDLKDNLICQKNSLRTCTICRRPKNKQLSFHMFPKDRRRNGWLKMCNLESVSKNARLCSAHFTEECFVPQTKASQRQRLRKDAIPTLCLPSGDNVEKNHLEPGMVDLDVKPLVFAETTKSNIANDIIIHKKEVDQDIKVSVPSCSSMVINDLPSTPNRKSSTHLVDTDHTYCEDIFTPTSRKLPRYPGDIKSSDFNSPKRGEACWKLTQKKLLKVVSDNKNLRLTIRRQNKKILKLENALKELRSRNYPSANVKDEIMVTCVKLEKISDTL